MPPGKSKSTGAYQAHRDRQRRRILDAAKHLFDENGIDRVTMAEITSVSGVQASTVYQYFSNKDEIVWAITGEVLGYGLVTIKQAMDAAPTALARISSLLERMAEALENHRGDVRFMAQFDAMYARDWPAEQLLTLESQINPEGFGYFSKLVREGIADRSLRPDLDPDLTMHAVINAVVGAQRRLASLGNKIEQEYGQPVDRLFRETIRVILLGLRAPETPAVGKSAKEPQKSAKARKKISKRRTP
jgi:AcrR family transcriptional regulator